MIRPLDNERCNRGITFKRNKIMKKQINNLMIALAFISTLGCLVGCVKQEREKSRQAQTVTSSTTKEDKETIKQKQLAYLKEHEKEIVDFEDECDCSIDNLRNCVDRTFYEGKIFIEMEILYVADCYGFSADTRGFLRRKSA